MPIYEYRCKDCGKVFEEIISGDLNKSIPCPTCQSAKTEKLMSAIGGISMGSSSTGPCGSNCSSASSCCSSGGGCPHAA